MMLNFEDDDKTDEGLDDNPFPIRGSLSDRGKKCPRTAVDRD